MGEAPRQRVPLAQSVCTEAHGSGHDFPTVTFVVSRRVAGKRRKADELSLGKVTMLQEKVQLAAWSSGMILA